MLECTPTKPKVNWIKAVRTATIAC